MAPFPGKSEFVNAANKPILTIDPDSGFTQITYQTANGLAMMQLTNTSSFTLWGGGTEYSVRLDGTLGWALVGGGGKAGLVHVRKADNTETVVLSGANGNIRLGGANTDGDLELLDQSGNVRIHLDAGGGPTSATTRVYIDGVNGDVVLQNGDCAEEFDLDPELDTAAVQPGTPMVIDDRGRLTPSTAAYDRRVAGVVSGAGSQRPGIVLGRQPGSTGRLPVALAGLVYCRTDASAAPIETGDLLTTSGTPGHAMKASDPARAFGAVIGKAMAPLAAGRGLVPILVSLL